MMKKKFGYEPGYPYKMAEKFAILKMNSMKLWKSIENALLIVKLNFELILVIDVFLQIF